MISIIVSWHNRYEIQQSIETVITAAKNLGGEVIIVNIAGNNLLLLKLLGKHKNNVKIIYLKDGGFNKSLAQNIGAYHARYQYMFFCDCDILLPKNILHEIYLYISRHENSFATLAGVRETQLNARKSKNLTSFGYTLKLKTKNGQEVLIQDNEEDTNDGSRQAPGLLFVQKKDFEKINGYNRKLFGWGWEDQDIICRLTLHAKLKRFIHGQAMHISHDDTSRMQAYKGFKNRWQSRDEMFRHALQNYDDDNFLGTYIEDNVANRIEFVS